MFRMNTIPELGLDERRVCAGMPLTSELDFADAATVNSDDAIHEEKTSWCMKKLCDVVAGEGALVVATFRSLESPSITDSSNSVMNLPCRPSKAASFRPDSKPPLQV